MAHACKQASLKQALGEVPKSGEVWCEGARIHLNPLSQSFDLATASQYLEFAIQFTPQYGDSFMECMRLQLLQKLLLPRVQQLMDMLPADYTPFIYKAVDKTTTAAAERNASYSRATAAVSGSSSDDTDTTVEVDNSDQTNYESTHTTVAPAPAAVEDKTCYFEIGQHVLDLFEPLAVTESEFMRAD
eukprot:12312-Heterococcus_DN1.PRE.1